MALAAQHSQPVSVYPTRSLNRLRVATTSTRQLRPRRCSITASLSTHGNDATVAASMSTRPEYLGLHHAGFLCHNLEKSLDFYCRVLGMEVNQDRPEKKLPYRGAWLWVGSSTMIHLMELPNPDPLTGRPEHGGRDRHACITVKSVAALQAALDAAGIPYTASKSGRPAVFARDPDGNALEFAEPV